MARPQDYDWIDDAFDDSKQDPLASRGMTGCSSLAVVVAVLAVVGLAVAVGLGGAVLAALGSGWLQPGNV